MLDVHDLSGPQNFLPTVATFSIPGAEPHNFWLDEQSGVLYVAWHGHGVWAIDVTGPLLGDLREQGREIANIQYDSGDCETAGPLGTGTCSYSVQLHDGLVYVSDYTSGLWVLDLSP